MREELKKFRDGCVESVDYIAVEVAVYGSFYVSFCEYFRIYFGLFCESFRLYFGDSFGLLFGILSAQLWFVLFSFTVRSRFIPHPPRLPRPLVTLGGFLCFIRVCAILVSFSARFKSLFAPLQCRI